MNKIYLAAPFTADKRFYRYLSPESRERLERIKASRARALSLSAELLARVLICDELGVKNTSLEFARTDKGKPYLLNYPQLHFSLSHTEGMVVAAISDKSVGIDIEHRDRAINENVLRRICSEQEASEICKGHSPIEIWTRKEALIKHEGGLFQPIPTLDTVRDNIHTWTLDSYVVSACGEGIFATPVTLSIEQFDRLITNIADF